MMLVYFDIVLRLCRCFSLPIPLKVDIEFGEFDSFLGKLSSGTLKDKRIGR
jgi:hypothetical protein